MKSMRKFVQAVYKHYGRIKAGKIRVEIHEQTAYGWVPRDLTKLVVARYPKDKDNIEELAVVLR